MSAIQTGRGKRRRKFEDEAESDEEIELAPLGIEPVNSQTSTQDETNPNHQPEVIPKTKQENISNKYIDQEDISTNSKKRKYELLHRNNYRNERREIESDAKGRTKSTNNNQWELEQFNKAKQIGVLPTNLDKVNLPDSDKYEYVFDDSQFVNYNDNEDDILKGDDEPVPPPPPPPPPPTVKDIKISSMDQVRKSLPVYKYREEFLDAISKNQVLIVVGETGSGKTTQLPQYLHEAGYSTSKDGLNRKLIIGCTQPRRVAATSVANRVASEMDVKLGHEVGYTIRFDDNSGDDTVIKYLTDGMLLREFLNDPTLSKYGALMIDEAHERTLSTEILLSLLKDIIKTRSDLKLIIASATINAEKFSKYFNGASILNIPGRRFPVTIHYTSNPEANYIQAAITTIFQIHLTQPLPGDILVFLTGQEEIESMEESLQESIMKLGTSLPNQLQICSIYANLPPDMQQKIFEPTPPNSRKVILATNIAETSITIDGISYVIDPGYVKQNVYNPVQAMESLVVVPCSRASVDQRAGRAGRVGPGKCFRLFTKWSYYNELELNATPEILRVNLSSIILLLLSLGVNDLIHFDFMDPPSHQSIIKSLELLYSLGALNSKGQLTKLGRQMNEFPIDPMLSKCVLTSKKYECTNEVITIISMLGESSTLFYRPKDKQDQANRRHEKFYHELGDHFTLLNIWNEWVDTDFSSQWCQDNYVQYKTLRRVKNVKDQLTKLCKRSGINLNKKSDSFNPLYIQKSIIAGYFPNVVKLSMMGDSYRKLKSTDGQPCHIHPSSSIHSLKPPPKLLLYHELVLTSKEYMRNCLLVDEKLVKEFSSHYYSLKDLNQISKTNK
ncbi:P-loop containing nucleoside triphosphate hydrolase protein [Scheffersomyces amazonensis]|uniref:P-loop containing nucleoside triphosphate hydrolase protein n=1 Tax=Scheffersomyces amazonensis TaxID=1078765 RepID=UPI00315CF728